MFVQWVFFEDILWIQNFLFCTKHFFNKVFNLTSLFSSTARRNVKKANLIYRSIFPFCCFCIQLQHDCVHVLSIMNCVCGYKRRAKWLSASFPLLLSTRAFFCVIIRRLLLHSPRISSSKVRRPMRYLFCFPFY